MIAPSSSVALQSVTADQYKGVLNGTVVSLTQPSSGGASGGAKLQSVQGSSGVGRRLAAVAVATSADGTRATLVDGVQQVALADTGGSGGSTLNSSMVGTWANATSPLTYTVRTWAPSLGALHSCLCQRMRLLLQTAGPAPWCMCISCRSVPYLPLLFWT